MWRRGYTMVEMGLVVVLVTIVSTMAVASFSGGTTLAQDQDAQTSADAALAAAETYAAATGIPSGDIARFSGYVRDITLVGPSVPSAAPGEASVRVSGWSFAAAARTSSGACWFVYESFQVDGLAPTPNRVYAVSPTGSLPCTADEAASFSAETVTPGSGDGWSSPLVKP